MRWRQSSIAAILGISTEQVHATLQYIAESEAGAFSTYHFALKRIEQGDPTEIEAKRHEPRQASGQA